MNQNNKFHYEYTLQKLCHAPILPLQMNLETGKTFLHDKGIA